MLKPLGMWEVRSKRIRKMTEQYLSWAKKDAGELHGIGKNGYDSYQVFVYNNVPANEQDKELKKYNDTIVGKFVTLAICFDLLLTSSSVVRPISG